MGRYWLYQGFCGSAFSQVGPTALGLGLQVKTLTGELLQGVRATEFRQRSRSHIQVQTAVHMRFHVSVCVFECEVG